MSAKTLLLTAEQGWGDMIMMARYFQPIKERWPGCKVYFMCEPSIHRLMSGAVGLDGPVSKDALPEYDYHLPIMDCPMVMGTTLETIPPAECLRIREEWPQFSMTAPIDKRRIGIVWAGSPFHGKDRARSVKAEQFQPIIDAHPDCQFYSLQCGPKQPEVMELRNVIDLAPQVANWSDTAQMIKCLDLVISVDTAIVHLAGSLGVPVWMLCPHSPDWRWMLNRDDSPWYPKLRLFRQPHSSDWQTPFDAINKAL